MINRNINAFYINEVNYFSTEGGRRTLTLFSHHGIDSKRFREFLVKYINENVPDFKSFDNDDWGSQQTITNRQFCY